MNILGVGIDTVEISRFKHWRKNFSRKRLERIFSTDELNYCFAAEIKTAERLAVRFAAKEAFYKALCSGFAYTQPFYTVCRYTAVKRQDSGAPYLAIDWHRLIDNELGTVHLSLTHTKITATALVIIERNQSK
jgi:holo-[acyl-carrier protein] synthase